MRAIRIGSIVGAAGVLAVLLFLFNGDDGEVADVASKAQPEEQVHPTDAAMSAAPAPVDGCVFSVGQRFAVDYATKSTWELPKEFAGATTEGLSGEVAWEADLNFEVLQANATEAILLAEVAGSGDALVKAAGSDISTPYLARINAQCEVDGFARFHDTPIKTARTQQSILHELWFSAPTVNQNRQVSFSNAVGRALGVMFRDDEGHLVRTIRQYERVWAQSMSGLNVRSSNMLVRRGGHAWFDSLRGFESIASGSVQGGEVRIDAQTKAANDGALEHASHNVDDYIWEDFLKPLQSTSAAKKPAGHDERVARMESITFPVALDQFLTRIDTKMNFDQQWRDMAAFLDAHPEQINEYATALVTEFKPSWKAAGFVALGATQHPAARESLLEIFREKELPEMDRVRSSLALATRADAGVSVARELVAEINRPVEHMETIGAGQQALLHLGVMAGSHQDDQEIAALTREALGSRLASVNTPEELAPVFAAIGNTGDLSFLPQLEQWSTNDDPEIRAKVAIGMRRMRITAVESFTLQWLSRETSFEVKREIFEVVQHQYQDAGVVAGEALLAESVRHLKQGPRILARQSIYRLIAPAVKTNAMVREAVSSSIRSEYEAKSGLESYLIGLLPQREVMAALSGVDSLRDQAPQAPSMSPALIDPVSEDPEPPPHLVPPLPTEAQLVSPGAAPGVTP